MNACAASRRDTVHPGAGARREYFKLPRDLAVLTRSFGIVLPAQDQRDAAVLAFAIECADRLLDAIPESEHRARFSASVVSCLRGEPSVLGSWRAATTATSEISINCPDPRQAGLRPYLGDGFAADELRLELARWLEQLREVGERRQVPDAFCEIARGLLENSESMRTTTCPGEFVECAVREGRLMVELLLLILAGVSTPAFDRFMRRLSAPANLIDKLRDAGADFRRGEMALRPTLAFRARLLWEILWRTFSLGIVYPANGPLLGWGLQSLFTELIWFRHSKAHSH